MNISGLTTQEISDKIKDCLPLFIRRSEKVKSAANLFDECYQSEFDEIKSSIPRKHRKHFKGIDAVNCMSGTIEFDGTNRRAKNHDYTIILLTDAESTRALLLLLQITSNKTDKIERVTLKNFFEEEIFEKRLNPTTEQMQKLLDTLFTAQEMIERGMDRYTREGIDEEFMKMIIELSIQSVEITQCKEIKK